MRYVHSLMNNSIRIGILFLGVLHNLRITLQLNKSLFPSLDQPTILIPTAQQTKHDSVRTDNSAPTLDFFRDKREKILQNGTAPSWMLEYSKWHSEQMQSEEESKKYLVVECTRELECAGLSDRLRYLPIYLLAAHRTRRILVIRWTVPHALDHFLVPPPGALDWRVQSHANLVNLYSKLQGEAPLRERLLESIWFRDGPSLCQKWSNLTTTAHVIDPFESESASLRDIPIVCVDPPDRPTYAKMIPYFEQKGGCQNSQHQGSSTKTTTTVSPTESYSKILQAAFFMMFEPTAPVLNELDREKEALGLVWGQYAAAHLRARYPSLQDWYQFKSTGQRSVDYDGMDFSKSRDRVLGDARNAIACAAQILPKQEENLQTQIQKPVQVYFASDTVEAVRSLLGPMNTIDTPSSPPVEVVGLVPNTTKNEHVHLAVGGSSIPPQGYYSIFVDLFLLAGAQCISVGVGGYGLFAGVWSSGSECVARYMKLENQTSVQHMCHRIDPLALPFFFKSIEPLNCEPAD